MCCARLAKVFAAAQSAATEPNSSKPPQCGVNKELNTMKPLGYHCDARQSP
jgi:hypothetical protein